MKELMLLIVVSFYLCLMMLWALNEPPWAFQRTAPYSLMLDNK